jgi:SAM-dependent methyltransferase
MSFDVDAAAYARFMGRFSEPLGEALLGVVEVPTTGRVLDVGCGPGALTDALVRRCGVDRVSAVDPSAPFVDAVRDRHPGIDVRLGAAEELPFADGAFSATLAQLVVHFMADPVRGIAEMARVTAPGGVVALDVWDYGGGRGPADALWDAARSLDAEVRDESRLAGVRAGHLRELMTEAGVVAITESELAVRVEHTGFDDWWQPFTLGVGPAGAYVASLDAPARRRLRERCRELLPDGAFATTAVAWAASGRPGPV